MALQSGKISGKRGSASRMESMRRGSSAYTLKATHNRAGFLWRALGATLSPFLLSVHVNWKQ